MVNQPKRLPEPATFAQLMPLLSGHQAAHVILTAHGLGLFTHLGSRARSVASLARSVKCSARGTAILLDACVALGVVRKRAGRYTNSPAARRYLAESSPDYRGAILRHIEHLLKSWARLDKAVRTGTSPQIGKKNPVLDDPATNRDFILAMHDVGYDLAKILAKKVDFSGVKSLLDLGGGPGSYSIALCEANSKLEATIVDLPRTLKVARKHLRKFPKVARRISTREADFFHASARDLGSGYDAALLSNILHAATPAQSRSLLKKVRTALRPGGLVVVNEFLLDDSRTAPLPGALFAVNMLTATAGGNTYTQKEIKDWLRHAGFKAPKSIDLDGVHVATVARNGPEGG